MRPQAAPHPVGGVDIGIYNVKERASLYNQLGRIAIGSVKEELPRQRGGSVGDAVGEAGLYGGGGDRLPVRPGRNAA